MRYTKVLLLIVLIFLTLVFFSQNHTVLSQDMELKLNLLFVPSMTSSPLPFYYLVAVAFFLGALFALSCLIWDKLHLSARLLKNKWRIASLEREVEKLKKCAGEQQGGSFLQNAKNHFANDKNAAKPQAADDVTAPDPDKP
ncbi:MAG: conserved hypothetical protein [Candidatus Desulfovibrio kirbyi]|jgi:ATP adenylyltransferase|uniref:Uncharacterized protein n=1 Tax=Candidatus Desulfovibrio kirbyi TaxID=2696086 RepID=A0A6L2R4Z3_9BACT|nr:LapA family protein [Desulfovibrio sp.]GFH62678.1 MAG: conserved hypothetical protein [Candidatus Desulfovibrio kirbyi]